MEEFFNMFEKSRITIGISRHNNFLIILFFKLVLPPSKLFFLKFIYVLKHMFEIKVSATVL